MAGTIYEAIHFAVFSNLLLLLVIKVYTLISTVPKPNLQSSLNVTNQVPTPNYKILHKHTHVYTAIASFVKGGMREKYYEAAVCISTNLFPLNFFILLSLMLSAALNYFVFTTRPKFQTMYRIGHIFMRYPPCTSRIHKKSRNVGHKCTTSL